MSDKTSKSEKTVIVITEKSDLKQGTNSYEPYLIQISGRETGQMYNLSGRTVPARSFLMIRIYPVSTPKFFAGAIRTS